jgi:extracellular factor (EF) 3-hydroxypalmitic acid methyl ester biosynthesis protein
MHAQNGYGHHLERLDRVHAEIKSGTFRGDAHVPEIGWVLELMRRQSRPAEWKERVDSIRSHPVVEATQQDPFTHRSFHKPRGYPGDAVLLDFIYRHQSTQTYLDDTSELGRQIFSYTSVSPASSGVSARRDRLAATIDSKVSETNGDARILSIACGHLRELDLSVTVENGMIEEFVAIDQDAETISHLGHNQDRPWLRPLKASVKDILNGSVSLRQYDLIYAAGLFDYLPDRACIKLLSHMQRLLSKRGMLLVANFLDGIQDRGYMECCMDWWLLYRTEDDMERLGIKAGLTPLVSVDRGRQIVYLEHHC